MEPRYLETAISHLRDQGVEFGPGLSDGEASGVESAFGFRFPPDLRALLQTALPVSDEFPDWRDGDRSDLLWRLAGPLEGIRFDIEHNNFWPEHWGERPSELPDALLVAGEKVAAAPVLVPVYSHRYMPDDPHVPGNPVFSVVQLDIIRYGDDLSSYLQAEFGVPLPDAPPGPPRTIELWDRLVLENG